MDLEQFYEDVNTTIEQATNNTGEKFSEVSIDSMSVLDATTVLDIAYDYADDEGIDENSEMFHIAYKNLDDHMDDLVDAYISDFGYNYVSNYGEYYVLPHTTFTNRSLEAWLVKYSIDTEGFILENENVFPVISAYFNITSGGTIDDEQTMDKFLQNAINTDLGTIDEESALSRLHDGVQGEINRAIEAVGFIDEANRVVFSNARDYFSKRFADLLEHAKQQ